MLVFLLCAAGAQPSHLKDGTYSKPPIGVARGRHEHAKDFEASQPLLANGAAHAPPKRPNGHIAAPTKRLNGASVGPQMGAHGAACAPPARPYGSTAAQLVLPNGTTFCPPNRPAGAVSTSPTRPLGANTQPMRADGTSSAIAARPSGAASHPPKRPNGNTFVLPRHPNGGFSTSTNHATTGTTTTAATQPSLPRVEPNGIRSIKPSLPKSAIALPQPIPPRNQPTFPIGATSTPQMPAVAFAVPPKSAGRIKPAPPSRPNTAVVTSIPNFPLAEPKHPIGATSTLSMDSNGALCAPPKSAGRVRPPPPSLPKSTMVPRCPSGAISTPRKHTNVATSVPSKCPNDSKPVLPKHQKIPTIEKIPSQNQVNHASGSGTALPIPVRPTRAPNAARRPLSSKQPQMSRTDFMASQRTGTYSNGTQW